MRFEDERYVRHYTRDTVGWLLLSFEAQGLLALIMRKVDRAGLLSIGKHGKRAVAVAVGHPNRWKVVVKALDELLDDGCVEIRGEVLLIPNFIEAQDAPQSDAQRQRESRARARDRARAQELLGQRPAQLVLSEDESRNVTGPSRPVTPCHPYPADPAVPSDPSTSSLRSEAAEATQGRSAPPPEVESPAASRNGTEAGRGAAAEAAHRPSAAQADSQQAETRSEFVRWLAMEYPDVRDPVAFERVQRAANPGVDILAEARKALAWETANPGHRKRNHGRFLNGWLKRAQDDLTRVGRPAVNGAQRRTMAPVSDWANAKLANERL